MKLVKVRPSCLVAVWDGAECTEDLDLVRGVYFDNNTPWDIFWLPFDGTALSELRLSDFEFSIDIEEEKIK